jgi:hypothetical protein
MAGGSTVRYSDAMGEIVLPFRTPNPRPVFEARSTLIISGIQTLRAQGLYERYVALLSPSLREQMMSLVAGLWIPAELAIEHYRTLDRLDLPKTTIEAIGAEVADRAYKTVLARVPVISKRADATPWTVLLLSHRNLDVNWRGSDMMITKEGPLEAIFIWAGQPCASVPYFVTSWGSFLRALTSLACTKAWHRVLPNAAHRQRSQSACRGSDTSPSSAACARTGCLVPRESGRESREGCVGVSSPMPRGSGSWGGSALISSTRTMLRDTEQHQLDDPLSIGQ